MKKSIATTLMFVLLWLTYADAQVKLDLRKKSDRSSMLGLNFGENFLTVLGAVAYNTSERSQVFFGGGLSFLTDSESDIPPAPEVAVGTLSVLPFEEIDFFVTLSGGAGVLKPTEDWTIYTLGLTSGVGIFKRIETESELAITPFLGVYGNYYRITSDQRTVSEREVTGATGLEIELSPTSSIFGSIRFSFENTDSSFTIGMIFSLNPSTLYKEIPMKKSIATLIVTLLTLNTISYAGTATKFFNKGVAQSKEKKYRAAMIYFDASITLNPRYVKAYIRRGYAKGRLKRYLSAIADYDTAIRLDPNNASAYFGRGLARYSLHQYA